jgi:anti-sigma B factor antagonist
VSVHRIQVERDGDSPVAVVRASGELDAYAVPDIDRAFSEAGDLERVVVDLAAVSFLDSTALGALVRAVRHLHELDGSVRIVLPDTTARRIFEITTLDRVLPVAASRAAAVAELRPAAG